MYLLMIFLQCVSCLLWLHCSATAWRWSRMLQMPPEFSTLPHRWHPLHRRDRHGLYTPLTGCTGTYGGMTAQSGDHELGWMEILREAHSRSYLVILNLPDDDAIVRTSWDKMALWSCDSNSIYYTIIIIIIVIFLVIVKIHLMILDSSLF